MGDCCGAPGYRDMFGPRFARRLARRYRKRGLDRTAATMVDFLAEHGITGASVLEIGGGVGDIQVELLRRGAGRTTNLELVDSYEVEAARLAADYGVADRVTRRQLDLAASPDEVPQHDVVVLHRVVCCYADYQRLLGVAAGHAARLLVFSHPPRNLLSRLAISGENAWLRMRRTPFRTYLHDPAALAAAAENGSLRVAYRGSSGAWRVVGLAASAP
jgi:2-polyprenyl-3-methyl-5-hydroxy-6-metoxy-1,4-benzoquinol methylase